MSTPSSSNPETTQQSLKIVTLQLHLRRGEHGHISVLDELAEPNSDAISISETDSEIAKPQVTFPRKRDHYTVTKYRWQRKFQHSSYIHYADIKVFRGQIDADAHPEKAAWIQNIISRLEELPRLHSAVETLDTYQDLVDNSHLVREYEATYRLAKSVWEHDSLASYVAEYTARPFRIKQFPQGFYTVPVPHHNTVRQILDNHLSEHNCGTYASAWGGFVVSPTDFSAIHSHVTPAYHMADDTEILDRDTLDRCKSHD